MRNRNVVRIVLALFLFGVGVLVHEFTPDTAHAQIPNASQATTWTCSLDDIGATLTRCIIALPDQTTTRYLTYVVAQSTTTTGGQFLLQFGTGTNCGTGTTSLLPSGASAVRLGAPANTAAPAVIALPTPLKIPAGKDLCVLGKATDTFTGQLGGFVGPQ